jgi:hypothetical protein
MPKIEWQCKPELIRSQLFLQQLLVWNKTSEILAYVENSHPSPTPWWWPLGHPYVGVEIAFRRRRIWGLRPIGRWEDFAGIGTIQNGHFMDHQ